MDTQRRNLGEFGSVWCKDTVAYQAPTGTFFHAIFFTEATVFASLGIAAVESPGSSTSTEKTLFASASSTLASMTFPANSTIYGLWTSWTLASGGLIAYKTGSKTGYANG